MPSLSCHQTAFTRTSPQFGCACVGELHQAPLTGYVVDERLAAGWTTPACPECGHHGWLPPVDPTT